MAFFKFKVAHRRPERLVNTKNYLPPKPAGPELLEKNMPSAGRHITKLIPDPQETTVPVFRCLNYRRTIYRSRLKYGLMPIPI